MEQETTSLEADRTDSFLSKLRAGHTPEQRELLRRLWAGSDHLGWVTAKALFHRLSTTRYRRELERLGGSLVTETRGGTGESYALRLLGALTGDRGKDFENLLGQFLAYEVKRYDEDMDVQNITREEVERDLHLDETALSDLYRLVTIAVPSLSNGSSGGPNWSIGVMRNIHDLTEVTDWPRFVREHALHDFDPALPVRAAAREEYLAHRHAKEMVIADLPAFWLPDHFRLFISHLATDRAKASALQGALEKFRISCFVAHVDIEPTKEWENEILAALGSAEALIALLTPDFHASRWTDQEVGFVMGRGRLVISVQLDAVAPYGFLGRSQAIFGLDKSPEELAASVFAALARHESTARRIAEVVVAKFEQTPSFEAAEDNAALLEQLTYLDAELALRIRSTYTTNSEVGFFPKPRQLAEAVLARRKL